MAGYERQIATALRVIKRRGQAVKWQVREDGKGEQGTPWRPKPTGASGVEHDVSIAFFPITKEQFETARAKGIELSQGSVMGFMGAHGFTPSQKDSILKGGVVLDVSYFDVIAPNGDPILYEIYFKGNANG